MGTFAGASTGYQGQRPAADPGTPSGLIVGKGEGGGKLNQGSDDDKASDDGQQQEQGVDDDSVPGGLLQSSPEPLQDPGKLL
jgi:hypothetical protein